jgi:hypothetical protein
LGNMAVSNYKPFISKTRGRDPHELSSGNNDLKRMNKVFPDLRGRFARIRQPCRITRRARGATVR